MDKNIQLQENGILLVRYREADIDLMYQAALESIETSFIWMPWCHPGFARSEAEKFIKSRAELWDKGTFYDFATLDVNDGTFLGGCGLRMEPPFKMANLGYWVRSSHVRKGIATTATILAAKFGFSEVHLDRIEIVVAVGNKASQRVAEKAGAKREGVLRNRLPFGDSTTDAVMFSFIPQDFSGK